MKKFLIVALSLLLVGSYQDIKAQSEVFAGGEISVNYVGPKNAPCSTPLKYEIVLKFFRDDPKSTAFPLPATKTVDIVDVTAGLLNRNLWTSQTVTLDSLKLKGRQATTCIQNSPVLTDGGYYLNKVPVTLMPNRRYIVHYGNAAAGFNYSVGIDYHSPENYNILAGQTFYMQAIINTGCTEFVTGNADTPPNERVIVKPAENKTPLWFTNTEIVETICENNDYVYNLNDYVYSPDTAELIIVNTSGDVTTEKTPDMLKFRIKSVLKGENNRANYVSGRSAYDPFPTDPSNPFQFNENTGIMTFKPLLAPGERYYTAIILVEVTEKRKSFVFQPDGNGNVIRLDTITTVSITNRQLRFIIGDETLCDDNLPQFGSNKFNNTQQAWEFDCAKEEMEFTMTKPMLLKSLDRLDFRIFRGNTPSTVDDNAYPIDEIYVDPKDVNNIGEFSKFKIKMFEPLGPGKYVMFTRVGNDGNTLENRCGFFLDEDVTIPIFINTKYEYIFKDDDNKQILGSQKNFCFPGNIPFNLAALKNQNNPALINRGDSFVFKYRGSSPNAPPSLEFFQIGRRRDKFDVATTITIPDPYVYPTTPLTNKTDRYWTVGVGLNYDYTYQKVRYRARCYAEDETFVRFFEHPKVNALNYDLCEEEQWPVVKGLVDPQWLDYNPLQVHSPTAYKWTLFDINGDRQYKVDSFRTVPKYTLDQNGNPIILPNDSAGKPVIGTNDFNLGGQVSPDALKTGKLNDSLDTKALGFGTGNTFTIRSIVTFNNGCKDTNFVKIAKREVEVEIGNDSIICKGEEYNLINSKSDTYFSPVTSKVNMKRQWYYGLTSANQLLPNDTTDTLMITERGWYKLVVTKFSENSMCTGEDSVYINVADELEAPKPICSVVTSEDGIISQRFYWPVVEGADYYEVRGIDASGNPLDSIGLTPTPNGEVIWYLANDEFGIHHWISGKEVKLYVRGANNEVEEGTSCKYGPEALADACEILVKDVNIFSPNGDGINDFLEFDLLETYTGNKLQIFNRWGKLLYESNDYQNDWDGKSNGKDLPEGTYFYILDVDDPSGIQDIFKGVFTLVR